MAISHLQSLGLQSLGQVSFSDWLQTLARARIDTVQIREKELDDRQLLELAREARRLLPTETKLLINGRLDIALAAGLDGAHLPADAPPTNALRRRFGSEVLLGRSTHHLEEIEAEAHQGADYVTFGPIFSTPSKPSDYPLPGISQLRKATRLGLPVLALGGIDAHQLDQGLDQGLDQKLAAVAAAGASGVAGIRVFQRQETLHSLVKGASSHFKALLSSPSLR